MTKVVYTYKGVDVETLTREELIEAYKNAIDMVREGRRWTQIDAEMERVFDRADPSRRGL